LKYPVINLAVNTCFASKRFARPRDWAAVIRDAGASCVELSADCECDPLYAEPSYLADWMDEVKAVCREMGLRVTSLYSGHGSYATLGLAHSDPRVRAHLTERWLKPYARMAAELDAGIGFYMHAFNCDVMADRAKYDAAKAQLMQTLRKVGKDAKAAGARFAAIEQMYSPQHIPWTISGAYEMIRETGLMLTVDCGHASGQHRFLRPDGAAPSHLTSEPADCDIYAWLASLGHLSPVIHLQQTSGKESAHRSFTADENASGIITPRRVLEAIRKAYDGAPVPAGAEPCAELNLTLELFYLAVMTSDEIIRRLSESVAYWRECIPRDGMTLDELL